MKVTKTKVQRRTNYDSLSLTVTYPTGGQLKYRIGRSGETLSVAFSNDPATLKAQMQIVKTFVSNLTGNNGERMDAVQSHFEKFTSGKAAIEALKTKA